MTYRWFVVARNGNGFTQNSPPWSFAVAAVPDPSRFRFSTIGTQKVNVPFSISVTAELAGGATATRFNETVALSSNPTGSANINSLEFTNGEASNIPITMVKAWPNMVLMAQHDTIYGQSNEFNVQALVTTGVVKGKVLRANEAVGSATVSLVPQSGSGAIAPVTSSNLGSYAFIAVPAGSYYLSAEKDTRTSERILVNIVAGQSIEVDLHLRSAYPPVLFLPGFPGSTIGSDINAIPELGAEYPATASTLRLHSGLTWANVGWDALEKLLIDNNYEVFRVPFDWRMSAFAPPTGIPRMQPVWQAYLLPAIEEAKRTTGKDQVHIVAHSTGGLVARSYIQNTLYAGGVESLSLVGTPNDGVVDAYFPWQGGDLRLHWLYTGQGMPLGAFASLFTYENMFSRNTNAQGHAPDSPLWRYFFDKVGLNPVLNARTPSQWKDFYNDYVPMLCDLIRSDASKGYLQYIIGSGNVSPPGNVADRGIYRLNHGTGQFKKPDVVFSKTDANMVRAKLFISTKTMTLDSIPVVSSSSSSTYFPEGEPLEPDPLFTFRIEGDGTVTAESAKGKSMGGNGLLDCMDLVDTSSVEHMQLVGDYAKEIASFITGKPVSQLSIREEREVPGPVLWLTVLGTVQPCVTDPQGYRVGIGSGGASLREIADATVDVNEVSSNLSITNPSSGAYTVELTGLPEQELVFTVGYSSATTSSEHRFRWLYHTGTISFQFTLTAGAGEPVVLQTAAKPPVDITAEHLQGDLTRLKWTAPTGFTPSSYKIYARKMEDRGYALLGSVAGTATAFDTGHAWNGDGNGQTWYYVILGVAADGTESYFTYTAENGLPLASDFSPTHVSGRPPLEVAFQDKSSGEITAWRWDFNGDGTIDSEEQNPTTIFSQNGAYTVSLTVYGPRGFNTQTQSVKAPLTIMGDFNNDGQVNLIDFNILVNNWQNPYTLIDFNNLVNNWGK